MWTVNPLEPAAHAAVRHALGLYMVSKLKEPLCHAAIRALFISRFFRGGDWIAIILTDDATYLQVDSVVGQD